MYVKEALRHASNLHDAMGSFIGRALDDVDPESAQGKELFRMLDESSEAFDRLGKVLKNAAAYADAEEV
jgi:hypothetical protein